MKKRKKPPSNPKTINLGLEILTMEKKFPSFKIYKINVNDIYWKGSLSPAEQSEEYIIKIVYHPYHPKVFILEPSILTLAPHRYSDLSLCLYYPNDFSFSGSSLICDCIVPWTCEWLYFYEQWLVDGIWWGKEAPHYGAKKE